MSRKKGDTTKKTTKSKAGEQSDAPANPGHEEKYTVEEIVTAIHATLGLLTKTAKRLNCSRTTLYRYQEKYQEVRDAIRDAREMLTDQAELNVIEAINAKDLETSKWYLARMGRDRGFGDKVDHKVDGEVKQTKVQIFRWGDQEIEF